MKITLWLILHIFLGSSSALSLAAGFFRTFGLLLLSVGFIGRLRTKNLATFQCFCWLLEDQILFLADFTEFEMHTL